MSSSERQGLEEQQLQEEIVELRGELGETVEALVHKADLPARAKERGAELTERVVDRGVELHQQVTERGSELGQQAVDQWKEVKAEASERGNELRAQAFGASERAREAIGQTPPDKWAKLACVGLALVAAMVVVRRVVR